MHKKYQKLLLHQKGEKYQMQQSKEARAAAAAYARKWRRKNPEKCREARLRYWEKKAAESKPVEEGAKNEQAAAAV